MSYIQWFEEHAAKHQGIVKKLLHQGRSEDEIIDYFDFDNMVKSEPDFCPLYAENKKCHDMKKLNCYLCACPNFRFNDNGIRKEGRYLIKSECNIQNGDTFGHENVIHQDCSSCSVPHHRAYVKKHFNFEWKEIMSACHP